MKPLLVFTLPLDLSPEMARALFKLLNGLADVLWQHY